MLFPLGFSSESDGPRLHPHPPHSKHDRGSDPARAAGSGAEGPIDAN